LAKVTLEQVQEWMNPVDTGKLLDVEAHGHRYQLHELSGSTMPNKIASCIRNGTLYEMPLLEFIRGQEFSGRIIDVGANIGNHALWFAVVCGLEVIAFEPVWHRELEANFALNGLLPDRATVHPVALGARAERADIVIGKGARFGKLQKGAQFPVIPLDHYLLEGIAAIKIDVEGWEAEVLSGAIETIKGNRPVIFTEQWGSKERRAIAGILEPLGYALDSVHSSIESPSNVGCWKPKEKR
jgi:FkbM family methyltransferase